ncbi:hypothetical protein NPIL_656161 [Nephila pilipes]|uniref:Uncharacterized protein n=1 Tax=Nephila pilipes TaxID=299642 RepID=A0A8X6NIG9_NEPPI|nr:hypothetical protein NPIL_656161 [Nephila pilipes]
MYPFGNKCAFPASRITNKLFPEHYVTAELKYPFWSTGYHSAFSQPNCYRRKISGFMFRLKSDCATPHLRLLLFLLLHGISPPLTTSGNNSECLMGFQLPGRGCVRHPLQCRVTKSTSYPSFRTERLNGE